jgi:hypothetical protein
MVKIRRSLMPELKINYRKIATEFTHRTDGLALHYEMR